MGRSNGRSLNFGAEPVVVAGSYPSRYVSLWCLRRGFDFPQIGFALAQKGSAGVGGEASSHVAQSAVYVICRLQ